MLPPNESGVTIGIGYDLRFAHCGSLALDWGGELPSEVLHRLAPVRCTVLVSLVYNPGPSLAGEPSSDRRLEMRRIREPLDCRSPG